MAAQVDINHAGVFELDRVFHDRERAQQVLNQRELAGDFKSWEDVQQRIAGMTDRRVHDLRDAGLTVGGEARLGGPPPDRPRPGRTTPRTKGRGGPRRR
jgi:hypothetical protein